MLYENVPDGNQFPTLSSEIGESGFDVQVYVILCLKKVFTEAHNLSDKRYYYE